MPLTIDFDKILDSIISLPLTPSAKEEGARLVEAWVHEWAENDVKVEMVAAETGFQIWLDKHTVVVGVMDRIWKDSKGYGGSEWKSTKGETTWWNAEKWLEEISRGPQIATYALALAEGSFIEVAATEEMPSKEHISIQDPEGKWHKVLHLYEPSPRMMVRAVTKTVPPEFWPANINEPDILRFTPEKLKQVKNAYLARAEAIRCLKRNGVTPWNVTGKHCTPFGDKKPCPYLGKVCKPALNPPEMTRVFDPSDPAWKNSVQFISSKRLADPNLVVLSASSFSDGQQCLEKYRLTSLASGQKEPQIELETGTALHAGLGEFYMQIFEQQQKGKK